LRREADQLSAIQLQRRATLGVDPKLVLVFELSGPVSARAFTAAGLRPLDARQGEAVIAFADDPQLTAFLERVDQYRRAFPDARTLPYEGFIDALGPIRRYGVEDRLTERLAAARADVPEDAMLLVDLECWHPGDDALAAAWLEELSTAVERAGGDVLDRYINNRAGLVLARARLPSTAIDDIAQLDQLARVDGVPELAPSRAEAFRIAVDELPEVDPPADEAPLIGLVDSGVKSAHPLIAPALADATALSAGIPDGEDAHGHGTRVAGLLLHGSVEDGLRRGVFPRPLARLLSVRVLGADNQFPHDAVWEHEIERAIRYCAEQGARVINLSIADPETRYRGAHATPVAGLLDQLARELDIVIVVPTGNVHIAEYAAFDDAVVDDYAIALLESPDTAMLDPAPAALALTVGAISSGELAGSSAGRGAATRRALGGDGWPAPFSRRGPGVDQAIKPELSAPGGSLAWDVELKSVIEDPGLGCLSTSGAIPERVFDMDIGTSYAAPLVARAASAVIARYPDFSANLVRALVLQAAVHPSFADALQTGSDSERRQAVERLVGHGSPRLVEAVESNAHRTVLIAEGSIPMDGTHVYEVPIPSSFLASGGVRGIDVALCFDPVTRIRRLDYMGCKMEFYLVRGLTPDEIESVFLRVSEEEAEDLDSEADESAEGDETEGDEDGVGRLTPTGLKRRLLTFAPPGKARSKGANQLGRKILSQRLRGDDGNTYHLVVQCRRRWAPEEAQQRYALAVCLWRSEDRAEIYDEIRGRVELPVEVEIER
jgi:subtilisin family serine protease